MNLHKIQIQSSVVSFFIFSIVFGLNAQNCLVAAYGFNGSGKDYSGNGNDLTVHSIFWDSGRQGKANSAATFNGLTDSMSVILNTIATNYSVWIKTSNTADIQTIFSTNTGDGSHENYGVTAIIARGLPRLYFGSKTASTWGQTGSIYIECKKNVSDGKWHHLVYAVDTNNNSNCKVYVDGVSQQIDLRGDFTTVNFGVLRNKKYSIGVELDRDFVFDGTMDDLQFFGCYLSSNDVNNLRNQSPVSLKEYKSNVETPLNIYPNPSKDVIHVSTDQEITAISLTDHVGSMLFSNQVHDNYFSLSNLEALRAGIYFLTVELMDGSIQTRKIIVDR